MVDRSYFILHSHENNQGILDNFSGFIYSSNKEKPNPSDYGVEFNEIKKDG
jgi:hypothetical protein